MFAFFAFFFSSLLFFELHTVFIKKTEIQIVQITVLYSKDKYFKSILLHVHVIQVLGKD